MKFGRISRESPDGPVARLVVVEPDQGRVIDLARAAALRAVAERHATEEAAVRLARAQFPGCMSQALSTGSGLIDAARGVVAGRYGDAASLPIEGLTWLPASNPPVLRDGLTFVEHIKGWHERMNRDVPDCMLQIPGYTKNSPTTVIGHDAVVPWPGYINQMDYELELGYVIGRRGASVRPEDAMQYVFGLTLYNDFSGRDLQGNELPIGMGCTKSKDFAHAIGPWITTLDEFPDLDAIPMEVRVNGETWARGNSGGKLWTPAELIAYVSLGERIEPGDVIGSGTMGHGSALELGRQLEPGDVVELEAVGIGVLRNVMGKKQEGLWWPARRAPFM
ncbi:fumarylacetoacetate hydrolase family protein [Burkholderia contaminans]|uniref:Fumarylacetoacetate hydrolase family protein n=1 Tax=Burkholderia contaminans TaxID=488447 RepID=A0A3N8PTL8_9BURK|nr:fumarylacetoacetate hydrolase family protein [Burkholderia contaminans]RQT14858.1 fumarylacetoacetate hydrolase family protein [Burkholderia contaminans]